LEEVPFGFLAPGVLGKAALISPNRRVALNLISAAHVSFIHQILYGGSLVDE